MRQRKPDKKALASANWTRAVGRKRTRKPLTGYTLHLRTQGVNGKMSTGLLRSGGKIKAGLTTKIERQKKTEEWLREEVRENRRNLIALCKWGVTLLAGLEPSLYFIRRDAANHLEKLNALPSYGTVPLGRWLAGTAFLLLIAIVFCNLVNYTLQRHVTYRRQLIEMKPSYSGIREHALAGSKTNRLHYWLFYSFPAFDFILWFYFRVTGSITIHW